MLPTSPDREFDPRLARRQGLIEAELVKLFLAYNRQITQKTAQFKAVMLENSLKSLNTEKIQAFFLFLRENFDTLPNDPQIVKIFKEHYDRFGYHIKPDRALQSPGQSRGEYLAELDRLSEKYPRFRAVLDYLRADPDPDGEADPDFAELVCKMCMNPKNFLPYQEGEEPAAEAQG